MTAPTTLAAALDAEYGESWPRTPLAWCQRAGIPHDVARRFGVVGGARVLIERRTYQPTPHGEPALIVAVRGDPLGDVESDNPMFTVTSAALLDLLAVPLKRPTTWALRIGAVSFLGAIEPQYVSPPPVRVHRSALGWLRSGCDGVVLLTDDPGEKQATLLRFRRIAAEDHRHGEELARILLRRTFEPEIVVPRDTRARRAA